jgi:hypothetical protein
LKKKISQGKVVEMPVNSKEYNSSEFCLDFFQKFDVRVSTSTYCNLLSFVQHHSDILMLV